MRAAALLLFPASSRFTLMEKKREAEYSSSGTGIKLAAE